MVNLIPKEVKKRRGVKSLVYVVVSAYVVTLAVILLSGLGLKTYGYLSRVSLDDKEAKLASLKAQVDKDKTLTAEATLIQDRLGSRAKYTSDINWIGILGSIADNTPSNVKLSSIQSTVGKTSQSALVTINGESTDAKSVILFKDKLATSSTLSYATITGITQSGSGGNGAYTFSIEIGLKEKK